MIHALVCTLVLLSGEVGSRPVRQFVLDSDSEEAHAIIVGEVTCTRVILVKRSRSVR